MLSCEKKCQQNNEEHFYFFVAFPYGQVHVKQPVHWAACSRQAKSCMKMLVAQSYLILYNPMDYSTPGFFVHGILQARILEWVASPFSRGSSVQFSSVHFSRSVVSDSLIPGDLRCCVYSCSPFQFHWEQNAEKTKQDVHTLKSTSKCTNELIYETEIDS